MGRKICYCHPKTRYIMKFLVTGANGFIGRSVIEALRCEDLEIMCIINRNKNITNQKNVNYIEYRISLENSGFFKDIQNQDTLIHLAWNGLNDYESDKHVSNELNISYNFIKDAINSGIKNILIAGTCFEYGNQEGEIFEDQKTDPINNYSLAKDKLRIRLEALKGKSNFK